MKTRLWTLIACLLFATNTLSTLSFAQQGVPTGDTRILAAREAFRTGDRKTLERLEAAHEKHVLDPYVTYWLLLNRLARPDAPPAAELADYLRQHPGSATAKRLQTSWLIRLAKDKNWPDFLNLYQSHTDPDMEMRCQSWYARLALRDNTALTEVSTLWPELDNAPEVCLPVMQTAIDQRVISEDALWQRFRRLIDSRSPNSALKMLSWLPQQASAQKDQFERAIKAPENLINRLPSNFSTTRSGRELALATLARLARQDAENAYAQFIRLNDRFTHEERAYMLVNLGHHAALSRLPQSLDWYRAAGESPMTRPQRLWRVRAALRAENWPYVEHYIQQLPDNERNAPEWIYWLGRAQLSQHQYQLAQHTFKHISDKDDFYGLLAASEFGKAFQTPPQAAPLSKADKALAAADPALRRALALYKLNLNIEAVREWLQAVQGKDDRFLSAAAQLALDNKLYDRAINTAELASTSSNFELRFLMPYRTLIEPQARQQNLDLAWIYGLMRQESRFIVPARSNVGAQGLMQVMPNTGKWVAQQIGIKNYKPHMLSDPQTNVQLGTNYMRLILQKLDNHPVLASAGYNAGPGRAQRWRDSKPLEAAIYIETIPFDETRDYVKKVLANAVIYAAIMDGRPQSIKDRLAPIAPSGTAK